LIKIAISVEAFVVIARTLSLGSVGYENKTNERGERLIVMVGVGLGYIVTDAIWVVVMIVVVRVMVGVMIGVMVGIGLGYIVTDAIWVVVMIVVDLLDVRLDGRLGDWRRRQSEGEGRAAWQGDCHCAAGCGSGNTTRNKTLNHGFLPTRPQQIGRLKLNLTWTTFPCARGAANSGWLRTPRLTLVDRILAGSLPLNDIAVAGWDDHHVDATWALRRPEKMPTRWHLFPSTQEASRRPG
jgi:hypothetical protein